MMKWVSRVFTSKFYPVLCIASHSHDVYALSHQEDTAWIVSLTILALVQDKRQRASLKLAHQDFTWQQWYEWKCDADISAAHLPSEKHHRGFIFLESDQKGAAQANSNEPHWRRSPSALHPFNTFLNEEKFQTCIPSARRKRREGELLP